MDQVLIYEEDPRKSESRNRKNPITPWPVEDKNVLRHSRERWYVRLKKTQYDEVDVAKVKKTVSQTGYLVNRVRGELSPSLPPGISSLLRAIKASRTTFPLRDNWDEEGSPGYSDSTWRRVEKFIIGNALHFLRRHGNCFAPPEITRGPKGSIDLFWRTNKRELLINIPADIQDSPSYYGDDREEGTENAIRGKRLDESTDNDWIFLWLTK